MISHWHSFATLEKQQMGKNRCFMDGFTQIAKYMEKLFLKEYMPQNRDWSSCLTLIFLFASHLDSNINNLTDRTET